MPRKKKTKKVEDESYQIEVKDWEIDYSFGLDESKIFGDGPFWEYARLIMTGQLLSPALKQTSKARVCLLANPKMDDHWKTDSAIKSSEAIGYLEILRDEESTLNCACSLPTSSLIFVSQALTAGKVKQISIYGTKLKWKRGSIFNISISTAGEDD